MKATPASSAHSCIEAGRLLRPDRHVVQQDFGAAALQFGDDLSLVASGASSGRRCGRRQVVRHVLGNAVEHLPHAHDDADCPECPSGKPSCSSVSRRSPDGRPARPCAHRCRKPQRLRCRTAGSRRSASCIRPVALWRATLCRVVMDALNERAGAIAYAGNCYTYPVLLQHVIPDPSYVRIPGNAGAQRVVRSCGRWAAGKT